MALGSGLLDRRRVGATVLSILKTYEHPHEMAILGYFNDGDPLVPGCWVRHHDWPGTQGILVANTDEALLVLWSTPPGRGSAMDASVRRMAREIQNEIDSDILRDLAAMNKAGVK